MKEQPNINRIAHDPKSSKRKECRNVYITSNWTIKMVMDLKA
jgi:hypothetical protein